MRIAFVVSSLLLAGAAAADVAGTYSIDGTGADGTPYRGRLVVTPQGELLRFDWDTGSASTGVGVQRGNHVAVGYGGPQCGMASYLEGADGSLDGLWSELAGRRASTEVATASSRSRGLTDYAVQGSNADGSRYRGTLRVAQRGDGLVLSWRTGTAYEGHGLRQDDHLAATYGAAGCGVAAYRIGRDGTLRGIWSEGVRVGQEVATPVAGTR